MSQTLRQETAWLPLDTLRFQPICGPVSHDAPLAVSQTIAQRFWQVAHRLPDAPAVSTATTCYSYGQMAAAAASVARTLKSHPQFTAGSRVVLLAPNSPQFVAAFYGILGAGGVVVPLPPDMETQALRNVIQSTQAAVLIAPGNLKRQAALLDPLPRMELTNDETPADVAFSLPVAPDNDLAALFFTAGSTGDPKGVMLSQRNLLANAESIQTYLEITSSDRPLCLLPFYHAFGHSVMQSHLLAGAHLVLDGKTLFPETIVTALAQHAATSFSGVPDLYRLLLERTSLGQTPLPALRYMAVAGGCLRKDMALAVAERIAPARFFCMYGQSEATARLAYLPAEQLPVQPSGCLGQAIPGVELKVVDDNGQPVAIGEVGELRARGPNVMLGYWQDPSGTAERLVEGWLSTGDLASVDEEGWITHRGRRNAIVKIAGFRVHPQDLETFALQHFSVRQAVAVPFESPQVGTRLALYVIPGEEQPLSLSDMQLQCRAELPRQLVPDQIHEVHDFPLNAALKVDRLQLSRHAEQEASRQAPPVEPIAKAGSMA